MQTRHILALILGLACILFIVVFARRGLNRSSKVIPPATSVPVMALSWDRIMEESARTLELPATVVKTDSLFSAAEPQAGDTVLIRQTLNFLEKNAYYLPAARFELLLARASENKEQWLNAGDALYRVAANEADTLIRDFLMNEAVACFDTVLQTEADNFRATLMKGLALADKQETMMQGVPLLLQSVRKDPDNIPANYTLGLLAIESGQLDKALSRFQKLISLQPSNPEYYYHAGVVYQRTGMKDQALEHYRKSLELTKDEKTKERIRQTIDQLN